MAFFQGTSGDNLFIGTDDPDDFLFNVFGGNDRISGGGGRDAVAIETVRLDFYLDAFLRVFGTLPAGSRDSFTNSPDADLVIFSNDIEAFSIFNSGGSSFVDFTGRSAPVALNSQFGNGRFTGGDGDDTIEVYGGNATIRGAAATIRLTLAPMTAQATPSGSAAGRAPTRSAL